jgi:uncharacterized membrane protein
VDHDFFHQVFSFICGQNPAHTWAPAGQLLPLCQRCTGLYIGILIGLILLFRYRPLTDAHYCRIHVLLLLLMAPFGFHLAPQEAFLRTMSGQWFGFGVAGLLWLLPNSKFLPGSSRAAIGFPHLMIGATSLLVIPVFARWGGRPAASILPWLALAGLAVTAGLLLCNGILLLAPIVSRIRRKAEGGIG